MAVACAVAGQGGGSVLDDPDFNPADWIISVPIW
jgi:hypothetical protein